jgi:hypothetical protein
MALMSIRTDEVARPNVATRPTGSFHHLPDEIPNLEAARE